MTFLAGVLSVLTATGWGDLLSLLVRVTLIAAVGVALCTQFRKASAAKRHLTAMATLIALVALPVAKGVLPALPLAILPAAPVSTASRADASSMIAASGTTDAVVPEANERNAAGGAGTAASSSLASWRLSDHVVLLSLLVSFALLLHVLVSFMAAAFAARRSRRLDDGEIRRELDAACLALGVSRRVDVRESAHVSVPVVWGIFRPVLLLPVGAHRWSRKQLRVVFLHEVAHVARHDAVGLILTRIATSLFWFHPLVWKLARVARRDCERSCDDLVLAAGERPADYAGHLLAIVRSMARPGRIEEVAPALAQRSSLEGRLVSILRPGQHRDSVSRPRFVATIALATLLLAATAAVQVVAAPAPTAGTSDETLGISPDPSLEPEVAFEPIERDEDEGLADAEALKALAAATDGASDPIALDPSLDVLAVQFHAPPTGELGAGAVEVSVATPPVYVLAGSSSRHKSHDRNQSGIESMRAGQYARAITEFEEEIRRSGSVNAMYNLACAHALKGDKQRAFAALENAIANGFDNTHHMTEDEDLRLLQGEPRFYQLTRLARDLQLFGSGRFGFGMKDEEDWRHSLTRFERVTREHPKIGRAWANLGFARLESGDAKGGTAAYQQALDLGYQTPTTLYNLACCSARSGDVDGAFRWLDRADKAGFEIGEHAGSDPDLDALRGDPRYGAMLERWDAKMAKEHREKQRAEDRKNTD